MNFVSAKRTKPFPPGPEHVDLQRQGAIVSSSNPTVHLICEGQTNKTNTDEDEDDTTIVMKKTPMGDWNGNQAAAVLPLLRSAPS